MGCLFRRKKCSWLKGGRSSKMHIWSAPMSWRKQIWSPNYERWSACRWKSEFHVLKAIPVATRRMPGRLANIWGLIWPSSFERRVARSRNSAGGWGRMTCGAPAVRCQVPLQGVHTFSLSHRNDFLVDAGKHSRGYCHLIDVGANGDSSDVVGREHANFNGTSTSVYVEEILSPYYNFIWRKIRWSRIILLLFGGMLRSIE